jgi:hypothetical protein
MIAFLTWWYVTSTLCANQVDARLMTIAAGAARVGLVCVEQTSFRAGLSVREDQRLHGALLRQQHHGDT